MVKNMKKILIFSLLCLVNILLFAEGIDEVTLVVSGDGGTKEEATNSALRSAVEQAYGAFVSANTTILNDSIVKDEIATITSGNIQKFEELTYERIEKNKVYVTLRVTVSVNKIISYVQKKGVSLSECEFAGATFGANKRLYDLNVANTNKITKQIMRQEEILSRGDLFDYTLSVGEPNAQGEVSFTVTVTINERGILFWNYVVRSALSLLRKEEDVKALKELGYEFYTERYRLFDTQMWLKEESTVGDSAPVFCCQIPCEKFISLKRHYLKSDSSTYDYTKYRDNSKENSYSKYCKVDGRYTPDYYTYPCQIYIKYYKGNPHHFIPFSLEEYHNTIDRPMKGILRYADELLRANYSQCVIRDNLGNIYPVFEDDRGCDYYDDYQYLYTICDGERYDVLPLWASMCTYETKWLIWGDYYEYEDNNLRYLRDPIKILEKSFKITIDPDVLSKISKFSIGKDEKLKYYEGEFSHVFYDE